MTGRLSFALVTMQPTDVPLVDEGISAADAQFQTKAQARAADFIHRAKILLLASHSTELCQLLCNKALLLSNGARAFFGGIEEGFWLYGETNPTLLDRPN
jgi:ABC-type polysaccharide/polyol phosphate transport system ATPase subunit